MLKINQVDLECEINVFKIVSNRKHEDFDFVKENWKITVFSNLYKFGTNFPYFTYNIGNIGTLLFSYKENKYLFTVLYESRQF